MYVDFPEVDTEHPDVEAMHAKVRQKELKRLEKQMKEMFKGSPWVEPDICWIGDKRIEQKAVGILGILKRILKGKPKMKKEIQTEPSTENVAAIQPSINVSICQLASVYENE